MRFCIVGSGRCGTSLLRGILALHPDVFIHTETHFVPRMFEFAGLGKCRAAALMHIFRQTTHAEGSRVVPLTDNELETLFDPEEDITVRQFCDRVGLYMSEKKGKLFWADKTPDYGFFMQQLQAIWPECKFVHLIRNGLDVASSMSRHPGFQWIVTSGEATWCTASFNSYFSAVQAKNHPISAYVSRWQHAVTRIRDEATRIAPGNYKEVRYEDILSDPRAAFSDMARFVGIKENPDWLEDLDNRVNTSKLNRSTDQELLDALKPRERALMRNLNYAD